MRILLSTLLVIATSSSAVEVQPFPDCAGPTSLSGVVVLDTLPFVGVPRVSRTGNTFRVALDGRGFMIPTSPPDARMVQLGRLDQGSYRVDIYRRDLSSEKAPPETYAGSAQLTVRAIVPPSEVCKPAKVVVTRGGYQSTEVGHPLTESVEVAVFDGQGRPVQGAMVVAQHVGDSDSQTPSIEFEPPTVATDTAGMARFGGTANQVVGVSDYRFAVYLPEISPRLAVVGSATFHNRRMGAQERKDTAFIVGFYSAERAHFFQTSDRSEASLLDAKPSEEWQRAGSTLALSPESEAPGTHPVCRFYGLPSAGLDSHFFSASEDECSAVADKFKGKWKLETDNAFRAYLPELITGVCPASTVPVYRLFNNRTDANHVYTTIRASRDALVAAGFISEGYGPDGVGWCGLE